MFDDDLSTRYFAIQRNRIQEAKRDPLEGIDKLAIPDTKVWGQEKAEKEQVGEDITVEDPDIHAPYESDSSKVTDKENRNPPTKSSTKGLAEVKKKLTEAWSEERTCATCGRREDLHYIHGAENYLGHHFTPQPTQEYNYERTPADEGEEGARDDFIRAEMRRLGQIRSERTPADDAMYDDVNEAARSCPYCGSRDLSAEDPSIERPGQMHQVCNNCKASVYS